MDNMNSSIDVNVISDEELYVEEDTMKDKYLTFLLDGQTFAISIEYVTDIINIQTTTKVPNCPDFVMGITNLRGKVIPIIDMRLRFGKAFEEYGERTCIIVVELKELSVGFVIDNVSEVLTLPEDIISPPPSYKKGSENKFVSGIANYENGVVLIVDCSIVFDDSILADTESE